MNWLFRRRVNKFLKRKSLQLVSLHTEESGYRYLGIAKTNSEFPLKVVVAAGYEVVSQPPFLELYHQPQIEEVKHQDEAIFERSFGRFIVDPRVTDNQIMAAFIKAARMLNS